MRLFVALCLPEAHRARLARLEQGLPGARWVAPDNLHLTLRFVGEVDRRQAGDLDAALARIDAEGFALTLTGLAAFGSGRRVRALYIGIEAGPGLADLRAKVERAVRQAGLPPTTRRFKPHVTLARFKNNPGRGNPGQRLVEHLSRQALFRCPTFVAGEFILYSSFLSQSGAIYTPEAIYPLAQRPAAALE